jgi:IclR helix-turn-helix domain
MANSEQLTVSITLTPTQIDEVIRAASKSRVPGISTLLANALNAPPAPKRSARSSSSGRAGKGEQSRVKPYPSIEPFGPQLSRSLLRGFSLLTCFGPDGAPRGIVELAEAAGMAVSTTHRYAYTLVEIGLLERDPKTRKYRLPGV